MTVRKTLKVFASEGVSSYNVAGIGRVFGIEGVLATLAIRPSRVGRPPSDDNQRTTDQARLFVDMRIYMCIDMRTTCV